MASKHEPQIASNANRGVRLLPPRTGRPNPYGVQWSEYVFDPAIRAERRTVRTRFFPSEKECAAFFTDLCRQRREGRAATLTRDEISAWQAFQRACGGTPWPEVVAGWVAWQQATGRSRCTCSVADHAKTYLAHCEALHKRGALAGDTIRQKRHKIGLLSTHFGTCFLDQIVAEKLEQLIDSIGYSAPATFNNVRKHWRAFFAHAVEARLIVENPVDRIAARDDGLHTVGILTAAQCAALFAAGQDSFAHRPALPRLALEAFAGLRFSSACRIEAADLRIAEQGILLPAQKTKDKRRHYIENLPPTLWPWLTFANAATWSMDARTYLELKSSLFHAAKIPHPHNCLRHSFATYHVALWRNPGLTAYLLCHRDQDKLWSNYKGAGTKAEAHSYFSITPRGVAPPRLPSGSAPARAARGSKPAVPPGR